MPYQSTAEDKKWGLALGAFYVLLAIALGYGLFKIWPPVPWPDSEKHPQLIAKAVLECEKIKAGQNGTATPVASPTATSTPQPTATPTPAPVATETTTPDDNSNPKKEAADIPTPSPSPPPGEPVVMPISFPMFKQCVMTTFDERLLLLVIVAGMLGSFIHGATSLADYMGNNRFSRRWTWFYVLRPVIGMALALVFYFVIRGGFLTTNVGATDINPYGIAALAGLVGMFSKQATDKLSEVFTTLFRSGEGDQKRSDPLTGTKSTPVKIEPEEVEVGSEALTIVVTGAGFVADSVAHLNDSPLTTRLDSPTQLSVDVPAEMFAEPAVLKLTVVNRDGTPSTPVELKVVAPATPVSLSIQSVAPAQVAAAAAVPLTVNGAGFVVDSIVKLNDVEQVTEFVDSAKLTVNLTVASIPTAGVVALKVVNPDGTESNTFDLTAT